MATRKKLTPEQVSIIKSRIARGEYQHRIAADYDINQGRISEIATGKRFSSIPAARLEDHHV
jgi:predicted XRE-type DNA-binding protein